MTIHLVILSVWLFFYTPSLNMASTSSQSLWNEHVWRQKWSHLLSGKWEYALGKLRNNCLVLFQSVWHYCLLSLKWLQWRLPTTLSMTSLRTSSQSTRARISLNSFLCFTGNLVNVAVRFLEAIFKAYTCGF